MRIQIPTNEEITLAIKQFKLVDWKNIDIESIPKNVPAPLIQIFPFIGPTPEIKYLFRATTLSDFNCNRKPEIVRSHGAPTKDQVKWYGRANLINDPVFYCAYNMDTAMVEVTKNENIYLVGRWRLDCLKLERNIQIVENVSAINTDKFKIKVIESNSDLTSDEIIRLLRLNKLFESEFLREVPYEKNYLYKYPAYVSNSLFLNGIDSIGFPSIHGVNKANFVLKKTFADKHLQLEKVFKIEREVMGNGKIRTSLLKVGNVQDEIIVWENPSADSHQDHRMH